MSAFNSFVYHIDYLMTHKKSIEYFTQRNTSKDNAKLYEVGYLSSYM